MSFLKRVCNDIGTELETIQREIDVPAETEERAVDRAKVIFCQAEGLADWSMRADRISVIRAKTEASSPRVTPAR